MADLSRHDLQVITEHDHRRDTMMMEQLGRLGVQLRILHATGDSSFDTTYELRYSFVQAYGPTLDLAVSSFVEALLRHVPIEKALQADYDPAILDERNPFTPSIANINTSAGDKDIDEWLERQDELTDGDGSGLHQCQWCYDQVTEGHEEFCRLNPNRNRRIVP